jgi:hypothetical protein
MLCHLHHTKLHSLCNRVRLVSEGKDSNDKPNLLTGDITKLLPLNLLIEPVQISVASETFVHTSRKPLYGVTIPKDLPK